MTYQLRFESNAFKADSAIGKALDALQRTINGAKKVAGVRVREEEVNRLVKLRGINQRVFARAMDWADNDFDQQISSEKWNWKGADFETKRKNGQTVTEPRDIIDTSALLNSKQRQDVASSITEFEWTAPYAEGVHDGYTDRRSGEKNPPRPWTEPTIEDLDETIQGLFEEGTK
ncbi:MAG: hypothetical protein ACO3HP_03920 [Candidatus Nanopelagicaceae bacterium]